jgi:transglutaminase-like putative cysteine protease
VIYRVKHVTTYRYTEPVLLAHHLAHLTPRHSPFQSCLRTQLKITPTPAETDEHGHDYYGNPVTFFAMREPHSTLAVHVASRVEVKDRETPDPSRALDWEGIKDPLDGLRGDRLLEIADFCYDSPYVAVTQAIRDYAAHSFHVGRTALECVLDFNHRIHSDFAYDPAATTVATPLAQVLSERRGVCQDFAHLAIAGLRAMGIPARYVSGYLLTQPPPGKPKLRGSDASHAWLSVFLPEFGWIDIDPTNDCMPEDEHVTLGWGRDFGDVSPLCGVVLGGGEHRLRVGVDVEPVIA